MRRASSLLLLAVLAACTDRKPLEAEALNRRLAAARAAHEPWAADPRSIVRTLLEPAAGRDERWQVEGCGAGDRDCFVAVVVDGFSDDSVRGARYDVRFTRGVGGMWEIRAASVAWRCWRTRSSDFGAWPCP